ncbi:unnamed protein product [Rotaria sordida]|uniref:Uncharacterized protein n=1 Tax=Rotaria sordida TaxID=392033 RepID=A0A819TNS5_9BILA|nr:unnamed protein product [Rotaria sordida]
MLYKVSRKPLAKTLVLSLKNLNPSWTVSQITNFIQQAENHPSLKRHQLVTKWLHQQQEHSKKNKTIYLTSDLYGKFLVEEAASEIKKVFKPNNLSPIFQDDQDRKHRTTTIKETVDSLFDERIEPKIDDANLADIWLIENVWRTIKEKLRRQQFDNESELEKEVVQQ